METLLLNKETVQKLIDMKEVIAAVEEGYAAFNRSEVQQPPIVSIELPKNNGEIDLKCGYSESTGFISVKAASGFWDNPEKYDLPTLLGTVLLFDGDSGLLKCVMDGSLITNYRTGAAGAVSAKLLARQDARVTAVIGAGGQARMQVLALQEVLPQQEIRAFSFREEELQPYKKEIEEKTGCTVILCRSVEEAVRSADLIITTTPSKEAIVEKEWVKPGTHIIAVGADMEGKQELDEQLFRHAKVVNDSIVQCISRGETRNAVEKGVISKEAIHGEIGELLLGAKPGRENSEEITIFDTTGMAVQDNVTAARIYEKALALSLGGSYTFF